MLVAGASPPSSRSSTLREASDDAPVGDWLVAGGIAAGVSVTILLVALRTRPSARAALLGTAAGVLFGLAAALTKSTVDLLGDGVTAVLGDWHVYALAAVGGAAFWLTQIALQSGLELSVATTATFDPVASLLLGTLLLDETLHESAAGAVTGSLRSQSPPPACACCCWRSDATGLADPPILAAGGAGG